MAIFDLVSNIMKTVDKKLPILHFLQTCEEVTF